MLNLPSPPSSTSEDAGDVTPDCDAQHDGVTTSPEPAVQRYPVELELEGVDVFG
jgi:hypothetical protein